MSKIKSYLGLCVKSNSVVMGQDRLKRNAKKVYVLILSPTASQNLIDLSIRLSVKFDCDCVQTKELLESLIAKENCKVIGLTNESLAKAVLLQKEEYEYLRRKNG